MTIYKRTYPSCALILIILFVLQSHIYPERSGKSGASSLPRGLPPRRDVTPEGPYCLDAGAESHTSAAHPRSIVRFGDRQAGLSGASAEARSSAQTLRIRQTLVVGG